MSEAPATAEGVISRAAPRSVDETVSRLVDLLAAKGIKLFTVIDHSGAASEAGQHLANTKLAVFGSPAAGTPVMNAARLAALDLPLKLLIWEDEGGQTWVSYNDANYLIGRYGLPDDLEKVLAAVDALVTALVGRGDD